MIYNDYYKMWDGEMMYRDLVAKRLSDLRIQKGVSAREMSLSIGQNGSYINRIENKKAMPSLPNLFYICEYLGITLAEFFSFENNSPTLVNEITESLKKLSSKQLIVIKDIINSYCEPNK